jgi:hypothetical protein
VVYKKTEKSYSLPFWYIFFHEGIAYSKKMPTFAPAIEKHR